jgi:predicted ATP-binding protein involved in virulence
VKLKTVSLENFRSKTSSTMELGSRLTLLIGENGCGKTSFLDAIAIAFGEVLTFLPEVKGKGFSARGDIRQVNGKLSPYVRVKVVADNDLTWDRVQRRDKSQRTAKQVPAGTGVKLLHQYLQKSILDPWNAGAPFNLPVIVQYGVGRALLDDLPMRRRGFPKQFSRFEALADALNSTSRFRSAFIWFYNKENEERRLQQERRSFDVTLPELDAVRRCVSALFPDLSDPHIAINPLRFVITQDGEKLEIDQLSDGYKTMLGLAVDLARRMAAANPHMDDPLAAEAIVMIDEVDLHLHPAWQQRVISDLLNCFTNTQFILTTHSPIVVEGVNNLLKKFIVRGLINDDTADDDYNAIRALYPLSPNETRTYQIARDGETALMDMDECLTADSLIDYFNQVSALFDQMRDLEAGVERIGDDK